MVQNDIRKDIKKLVEAVLFISGKAMSINEISAAVSVASPGQIKNLLKELEEDYKNADTSLSISLIGEKYIMDLKEPYGSKVNSIAESADISKSSLRILAYISKNEPIMQSNVVKIFGSSAYQHIKELIQNDFISASRYGRTKKINTTQKFVEYFNLSKKD